MEDRAIRAAVGEVIGCLLDQAQDGNCVRLVAGLGLAILQDDQIAGGVLGEIDVVQRVGGGFAALVVEGKIQQTPGTLAAGRIG